MKKENYLEVKSDEELAQDKLKQQEEQAMIAAAELRIANYEKMQAFQKKTAKNLEKIKRMNKMYFRDKNGSARRLDLFSDNFYSLILMYFLQGKGTKRHARKNRGAKHPSQVQSIILRVPRKYSKELSRLSKEMNNKPLVITYQDTANPLVELKLAHRSFSEWIAYLSNKLGLKGSKAVS